MYSAMLIPMDRLLKQVLRTQAVEAPMLSTEKIHQAAAKGLRYGGSSENAAVNAVNSSSGFLSSGFVMSMLVTTMATVVITGGLLAGGVFPGTQGVTETEQAAIIEVMGEIVFTGEEGLPAHVNPKQASVWADNEHGVLASQSWWITALGNETILYSGMGDSVNEALTNMYALRQDGEYELRFRMEDGVGKTYTLTRQFTIQQ